MDNELSEHDPYNEMKKGVKQDIRPELPGDKSRDSEANSGKTGSARSELQDAENSATGGFFNRDRSVEEGENGGFSYIKTGKLSKKGLGSKFKFAKMSAATVIIMMLIMVVSGFAMLNMPIFTIGHLDFNLQDALGFTKTSGILQKLATRIIQKKLAKGEVPSELAGDLAMHGINVGQMTASGDFVKTNVYIADVDKLKDVATLGHFEVTPSEGELAVLYDGQVILADDFVNTVESNMRMFADYTEALDMPARYYYSSPVNDVYENMKLDRGAFVDWVDTGDPAKNQKKFNEKFKELLENNSSLEMGACEPESSDSDDQDNSDTCSTISSGDGDASYIVEDVASKVTGADATSRAAQLLNAAISAGEPYLAASAFVGIESPIQQARIEGTGPVNELMNLLNTETTVSYTDAFSGETKTTNHSVMTTPNFVAAVSRGKFSTGEAASFARDRAILVTNTGTSSIINDTTVSSTGQDESSILIPISFGGSADSSELSVLEDSVTKAMVDSNYELMTSQVGGNRIIEGGSFLSNMINSHVIAAMPSDGPSIEAYNREAKVEVARMAAAERATKSPFDVSSPYTFMGSIAHSFANAMIRSGGNGGFVSGTIGTVANLTNDSVKGLWGSVVADGEDDTDFGITYGDYCDTVKSIGTEGDIYCTAHTVISTGYMDYDEDDWEKALSGDLDENGIVEGSDLADFEMLAMDRWATVGVESANVCEKYHEMHDNAIESIISWLGIFEACDGIEDIGTGAAFTYDNVELYAGYMLFDEVSSLLDGSVSKATSFREQYYKKHPLDNSRAGRIARISGMTKHEAEVALAYADYLTFIAKYNPLERYAFGSGLTIEKPADSLVKHSNQIAMDLYAMWHGRIEYDDLRGRVCVM